MTKLQLLERLFIQYLIQIISEKQIVEWAIDNYTVHDNSPINSEILEIASLLTNTPETSKAGSLLKNLIHKNSLDFERRKELIAMEVFLDCCQNLLKGTISPFKFCKTIDPIEQIFNFPSWLGNLFNVCDWIPENQSLNENMLRETKQVINILEEQLGIIKRSN